MATRTQKLVHVIWRDTVTKIGWVESSEFDAEGPHVAECHSVGWIVREDKRELVLAGMKDGGVINCCQAIPTGCICRVRRLREPK